MRFEVDRVPLQLMRGAILKITDADGKSLRVLSGRVWVTQEGSLDDVFLDAGHQVFLRGSGTAVVSPEPSGTATATVVFDSPLAIRSRDRSDFRWLAHARNWLTRPAAA